MRFFRASESVYEQTRAALDAAWGFPDSVTRSCIEPSATAPRDAHGRVVLSVHDEFCTYSPAADLLPQLLASGEVQEIDLATYKAALPSDPV